jgi:hypothetical protein
MNALDVLQENTAPKILLQTKLTYYLVQQESIVQEGLLDQQVPQHAQWVRSVLLEVEPEFLVRPAKLASLLDWRLQVQTVRLVIIV